jgi:hypothetical protein
MVERSRASTLWCNLIFEPRTEGDGVRETLSTSEDDSAAEETLPRWTYLLQLLIVGVVFLFVCFATTKKQILTTTDSMWLVEMVIDSNLHCLPT